MAVNLTVLVRYLQNSIGEGGLENLAMVDLLFNSPRGHEPVDSHLAQLPHSPRAFSRLNGQKDNHFPRIAAFDVRHTKCEKTCT